MSCQESIKFPSSLSPLLPLVWDERPGLLVKVTPVKDEYVNVVVLLLQVAGITGRSDALACLLMLISFLLYSA